MLSVIKVQLKVMIFNFFKSHTHQDLINLMFCFQLESSHRWFKFHFNNPTYDLIFLSSIRIISINPSLPPHPLTLLIIIPLIKHNLNLSINGVTSLPCTLYPMRPFLSKPDLVFLLVVKLSRYYCISFRVGFLSTQFLINPKYWILWSHHLPFPIFSSASSPSPSRRAVSYGWCCLGSLWETHTNCSGEQASLAIEALETSITHLSLVKSRVLIFKATHQFEATGALKFLNTWSYQVIRISILAYTPHLLPFTKLNLNQIPLTSYHSIYHHLSLVLRSWHPLDDHNSLTWASHIDNVTVSYSRRCQIVVQSFVPLLRIECITLLWILLLDSLAYHLMMPTFNKSSSNTKASTTLLHPMILVQTPTNLKSVISVESFHHNGLVSI